jgi:hypothetical protein
MPRRPLQRIQADRRYIRSKIGRARSILGGDAVDEATPEAPAQAELRPTGANTPQRRHAAPTGVPVFPFVFFATFCSTFLCFLL